MLHYKDNDDILKLSLQCKANILAHQHNVAFKQTLWGLSNAIYFLCIQEINFYVKHHKSCRVLEIRLKQLRWNFVAFEIAFLLEAICWGIKIRHLKETKQ